MKICPKSHGETILSKTFEIIATDLDFDEAEGDLTFKCTLKQNGYPITENKRLPLGMSCGLLTRAALQVAERGGYKGIVDGKGEIPSKITRAQLESDHILPRHVGLDLQGRTIPIKDIEVNKFTTFFPMGQPITIEGKTVKLQKLMNMEDLMPAMKETFEGGIIGPGQQKGVTIAFRKKLEKQQISVTLVHDASKGEVKTFIPESGPGVVRWSKDTRKFQEWRNYLSVNGDNWFDVT